MEAQKQKNTTLPIKELVDMAQKGMTSREIAKVLKVSNMKVWRNLKLSGLNANKFPAMAAENRTQKQKIKLESEYFNEDAFIF